MLLVLGPDRAASRVAAAKLPARESPERLLQAVAPWLNEALDTGASRLRHGPEGAAPLDQRSCLVALLLGPAGPIGRLYADVEGPHGRFEEADRALLAMLAAMAAAALASLREGAALKQLSELQAAAQRAPADVLQAIGSAAGDPGPVFDRIVESCSRAQASLGQ